MSILNIEQGANNYTEITTFGTPELVSNRPGIRVTMETTSKALEFMKKLLPPFDHFYLTTLTF